MKLENAELWEALRTKEQKMYSARLVKAMKMIGLAMDVIPLDGHSEKTATILHEAWLHLHLLNHNVNQKEG